MGWVGLFLICSFGEGGVGESLFGIFIQLTGLFFGVEFTTVLIL